MREMNESLSEVYLHNEFSIESLILAIIRII